MSQVTNRHAHLQAQWKPGQRWETLVENCTQWVPVSESGYAEPLWEPRQEYRRMDVPTQGATS